MSEVEDEDSIQKPQQPANQNKVEGLLMLSQRGAEERIESSARGQRS